MAKNLVFGLILTPLAQIRAAIFFIFFIFFFPKNLPPSVTISHGQLSSCRISETTTDPILKKLSERQADRRTEGQTDGQTEESDFIGCCLANVERPKKYNLRKITVLVDKLSNQNLLS